MITATKKNRYLWLLQLTKGKNAADGRSVLGGDYEGSRPLTDDSRCLTTVYDGSRLIGKKNTIEFILMWSFNFFLSQYGVNYPSLETLAFEGKFQFSIIRQIRDLKRKL